MEQQRERLGLIRSLCVSNAEVRLIGFLGNPRRFLGDNIASRMAFIARRVGLVLLILLALIMMAQLVRSCMCGCTTCAPANLCLNVPSTSCMPCVQQCVCRPKMPIMVRPVACTPSCTTCACIPSQACGCAPSCTACACIPSQACGCASPCSSLCSGVPGSTPIPRRRQYPQDLIKSLCFFEELSPSRNCLNTGVPACSSVCSVPACSSICSGVPACSSVCGVPMCSVPSFCRPCCLNGGSNNDVYLCVRLNQCAISSCGGGCCNNNGCCGNANNCCGNNCCCGNANNRCCGNANNCCCRCGNNDSHHDYDESTRGGKRGRGGKRRKYFRDYTYEYDDEDYSNEDASHRPRRPKKKKNKKTKEKESISVVHHVMTVAPAVANQTNPTANPPPQQQTAPNLGSTNLVLDHLHPHPCPNDRDSHQPHSRNYRRGGGHSRDDYDPTFSHRRRRPYEYENRSNPRDDSRLFERRRYEEDRRERYENDRDHRRRKLTDVTASRQKRSTPPRVRLRNPGKAPVFDVIGMLTRVKVGDSSAYRPTNTKLSSNNIRHRRHPVFFYRQPVSVIQGVQVKNAHFPPSWTTLPTISLPSNHPIFQQVNSHASVLGGQCNQRCRTIPVLTIIPSNGNQGQTASDSRHAFNMINKSEQKAASSQGIIQASDTRNTHQTEDTNSNNWQHSSTSNNHQISPNESLPTTVMPPLLSTHPDNLSRPPQQINSSSQSNNNQPSSPKHQATLLVNSPGKGPIQIPIAQLIPELKNSNGKTYLHGESIIQRDGNNVHIHHIKVEQKNPGAPQSLSTNSTQAIHYYPPHNNQNDRHQQRESSVSEEIPIHVLLGLKDGRGLKEIRVDDLAGPHANHPNLDSAGGHIAANSVQHSHNSNDSHRPNNPPMKVITTISTESLTTQPTPSLTTPPVRR